MKTMFVWENVDGLTNNYHDGGGTVVIADNLEVARKLLVENGVSEGSEVLTESPNYTTSVVSDEDKVFIFPDAGCC